MKTSQLVALVLSGLLVAACAGTGGSQSGTQSGSQRSTGQVVDDATVTTKVKSALMADPDISGLKINVDTMQGRVRLKGEVKSMALRKKAESIARGVDGVKSVDNQLVITG